MIFGFLCPIHVVTSTLISNLATDYIQKRTGQSLVAKFYINVKVTTWIAGRMDSRVSQSNGINVQTGKLMLATSFSG